MITFSRKPILLIAAAVWVSTISCNVNDSDEFTDTYSYNISPNSTIAIDSTRQPIGEDSTITTASFSITQGENIVFIYEHTVHPPDDVLDGGSFETLVFQIPSDAGEFELTPKTFKKAPALYRRSIFNQLSGASVVTSGNIQGQKLSEERWIVRADVSIKTSNGTYEISFDEPFKVN